MVHLNGAKDRLHVCCTTSPSNETNCPSEGVSTLGDARAFSELTSKIPPLGSMLNFDADVKKTTARHQTL